MKHLKKFYPPPAPCTHVNNNNSFIIIYDF